MRAAPSSVPLWLKVLFTLLVGLVAWSNQTHYGVANFLWFSDIALILTAVAMWLESSLLASTMTVAILLPEIAWTIALCIRLFAGVRLGGVNAYMFDLSIPFGIRALSMFHVVLPVLLLWLVHRLGYDRRALLDQTLFCWLIFPATFFLTQPSANINWVFGPGFPQHFTPPTLYLLAMMLAAPLFVYLPTHLFLGKLFRSTALLRL